MRPDTKVKVNRGLRAIQYNFLRPGNKKSGLEIKSVWCYWIVTNYVDRYFRAVCIYQKFNSA